MESTSALNTTVVIAALGVATAMAVIALVAVLLLLRSTRAARTTTIGPTTPAPRSVAPLADTTARPEPKPAAVAAKPVAPVAPASAPAPVTATKAAAKAEPAAVPAAASAQPTKVAPAPVTEARRTLSPRDISDALPEELRDKAEQLINKSERLGGIDAKKATDLARDGKGRLTATLDDFFAAMKRSYDNVASVRDECDETLIELKDINDAVVAHVVSKAAELAGRVGIEPGPTATQRDRVRELRRSGKTTGEIASTVGLSEQEVELV